VPGSLQLQDISRDGRVLAVLDHLRSSVMCQPPGETRERDLSWLDFSALADLTPDGKLLLIGESGEGAGSKPATYLRKTDGSAAVRIMDGSGQSMSPDGKWIAAIVRQGSSSHVGLFPTSAGEPRFLPADGVDAQWAGFSSKGDQILVWGGEPGRARYWVRGVEGGKPRPVTPEGFLAYAISPDDKFLLAGPGPRKLALYPLDGGAPRPIPDPQGRPIQWSADGRSLYVVRYEGLTASLSMTDLATGRSVPWKTINLADPAGTAGPIRVIVTPDGKAYAYTLQRVLSDLYLIDGLK
jgi:Tol biopolymer transport system component